MNKLLLIDGNSVAFRAFYALPLLHNDKGQYTNAVYGFSTMLLKLLEEEKPTHILVAFDAGKVTFRHSEFKEYKGKREKTPPELAEQLPLIRKLLDAFSIRHYELEQYEADDIIGTLTKQIDQKDDWQALVVTGDKDLLQLVSDNVHIALTRKGISEVERYDLAKLEEVYQLKPEQIIDLKGLMGDASDNIPGVPGVGEKTALKLLHQFASMEQIYEHLDQVSGKKLKENLMEHKSQAFLSKSLATIHRQAPLELTLEETAYNGYNPADLAPVLKELAFESLLDRLGLTSVREEKTQDSKPDLAEKIIVIEKEEELESHVFSSPAALQVEIIEDYYHGAPIHGFSICNQHGLYFIPKEIALNSPAFISWLADSKKEKWVHNFKKAQVALKWQGFTFQGVTFDTYLAAYLLNPSQTEYDLANLASTYGGLNITSDEQVYGKGAKRKLPEDTNKLQTHIAAKAKAIYHLKERLEAQLEESGLFTLYSELELPLSFILGEMEARGVKVDRDKLVEMGSEINGRLEQLTQEIYALAGVEFNINSPKQLGEILFDKLGLPVIKKTKTGYSTSAEVLEQLEPQHEIIGKILDYRQLGKLNSTYIEGLLKMIHPQTGKVHTIFQQTITTTGRLSSTDPNLQNIPIRLEEGRKIRQAFIPSEKGRVIFSADYSQIELRIMAHLSNDQGLISAFLEDKDIHAATAADVFHVPIEDVTPLMRRQAKAVNFGIIYGISDYGLSQNLQITRKAAKEFIERYFASYPGVKQFMQDIIKQARKDGYVTTLMQRRRYLPDINSKNFNLRSFAERTAINTPIQGTAADIIKKAMIDISERLKQEQMLSVLLLQVHDELIFEVPEEELEAMQKLVPEVMEAAIQLKVPLKVDISYGPSWYEAK